MPITDEVEALLKILGPFYELVDEKRKISQVSDLTPGAVTALCVIHELRKTNSSCPHV